jgi:VIT1/CCC1 family predicted Fe2+/Mn2+ transporter
MTSGRAEIKTMIVGALGCNLAWGIIDAGMYLMSCLEERGRGILMLRAVRKSSDAAQAQREIAEALPEPVAEVMSADELEAIRAKLLALPEPPDRPRLTKEDWLGAAGVCLLVFLSTLPVVIPFLFIHEGLTALRVSNAVGIGLLFLCGYAFGWCTGVRPWAAGLLMVGVGSALVGVAIALGG